MRCFSSYGPVNAKQHFLVPRAGLVERCVTQLLGDPEEGGHFFTLWGPRQSGKTWIMRRVMEELQHRLGERVQVALLPDRGVLKEQDRPLILFIDEKEHRPALVVDEWVAQLPRLYGLVLVGVQPGPSVDSLRIPHLSIAEVEEMFRQYQDRGHRGGGW